MKNTTLLDVTSCTLLEAYRSFAGMHRLHPQCRSNNQADVNRLAVLACLFLSSFFNDVVGTDTT
jgi:hypothetical protein